MRWETVLLSHLDRLGGWWLLPAPPPSWCPLKLARLRTSHPAAPRLPAAVDFHPNGQLFTGGADKEVKVWEVSAAAVGGFAPPRPQCNSPAQPPAPKPTAAVCSRRQPPHHPGMPQVERGSDGYPSVRHLSSLTAHLNTVNCVRFSPTGASLLCCRCRGLLSCATPAPCCCLLVLPLLHVPTLVMPNHVRAPLTLEPLANMLPCTRHAPGHQRRCRRGAAVGAGGCCRRRRTARQPVRGRRGGQLAALHRLQGPCRPGGCDGPVLGARWYCAGQRCHQQRGLHVCGGWAQAWRCRRALHGPQALCAGGLVVCGRLRTSACDLTGREAR